MDIALEQVCVRHPKHVALDRLSVSFPGGTRAVIAGGAGSGKTTLLKCLAGLVSPSEGRVLWDGQDPARLSDRERRELQGEIGMVFQTDALFDAATVAENVTLPLLRRGIPPADARARADAVLAEVRLTDAADARPAELSGGMRKRAGLARALVAEPAVLLADDPLAGLDPGTAKEVAALLDRASAGRTLLVAAADVPEWWALPRRVVLEAGRISEDRSPGQTR